MGVEPLSRASLTGATTLASVQDELLVLREVKLRAWCVYACQWSESLLQE